MNDILCVIIGGLISFISCTVTQQVAKHQSHAVWLREKKYNFYIELITAIQKINITICCDNDAINFEELSLDVNALKENFDSLGNYLTENSALIYLYVPKEIYKGVLRLQDEIYKIISSTEFQTLNLAELKTSKMFSAVMHAKQLCKEIKQDLLL